MKFVLANGQMTEVAEQSPTLMDRFNRFSDWLISKEVEVITGNNPQIDSSVTSGDMVGDYLWDKIIGGLGDFLATCIIKLDGVIPEIGAIGTVIAGVSMMILGVRKPLVYYTFFLGGCIVWQIASNI
jgi:hypothetical protein